MAGDTTASPHGPGVAVARRGASPGCRERGPGPGLVPLPRRDEVAHLGDVHREQVEVPLQPSADTGLEGPAVALACARVVHRHGPAVHLDVALRARPVGHRAVDDAARITQQVESLGRLPHHPEVEPGQGSVTAPRSAPVTRRAYLASTPVVYRGAGCLSPALRRSSSSPSTSRSMVWRTTSTTIRSPSATRPMGPPSTASGATCPMQNPCVPPENRPSVTRAQSPPRPTPFICLLYTSD